MRYNIDTDRYEMIERPLSEEEALEAEMVEILYPPHLMPEKLPRTITIIINVCEGKGT